MKRAWIGPAACTIATVGLIIWLINQTSAAPLKIETESYRIPATDSGIELYIRNKHPAGVSNFSAEKILLFVHGATYPAETAFDLPLNGLSMMDYIAQQGWDVYLVDVRGYGGSTRPPEMELPANENKPIVDTAVAVKDVGSAVDHILQKRGVSKINLIGWSWGTAIMGMYTVEHNDKVNRLVLYAPLWLFKGAPLIGGDGPLPAYRTVTRDSAKDRWLKGVSESKKADLIPAGWFEQWADATWATDPVGARQNPPVLRAPRAWLRICVLIGLPTSRNTILKALRYRRWSSTQNGMRICRAIWRKPTSSSSRTLPTSGLSSLAKELIQSSWRRTECSSSMR